MVNLNLSIEQLKLIFESGYEMGKIDAKLADEGWHYDSTAKDLELAFTLCDVLKISLDEAGEMLKTC